MSFLTNIKGTLLGVQHDISESFRNLTTKEKKSQPVAKSPPGPINLDAGADLLNRFQNKWAEIHDYSEESAKKAKEVDTLVTTFCDQYEHCHNVTNQLIMEVQAIPQLVEDIHGVMEKIGSLEVLFTDIEAALLQLEDSIEEAELEVNKREHIKQLASYTKRRSMELEVTKVHLANQHAQKVESYEGRLQAHLKQRQEAFQEASSEELQQYRLTGQTPEKVHSPTHIPGQRISLADVELAQDTTELDEFLETEDFQESLQPGAGGHIVIDSEDSATEVQNSKTEDKSETSADATTKDTDKQDQQVSKDPEESNKKTDENENKDDNT